MKLSLPLKLGIFVVLLFSVVIVACFLWNPVKTWWQSRNPKHFLLKCKFDSAWSGEAEIDIDCRMAECFLIFRDAEGDKRKPLSRVECDMLLQELEAADIFRLADFIRPGVDGMKWNISIEMGKLSNTIEFDPTDIAEDENYEVECREYLRIIKAIENLIKAHEMEIPWE